MEYRYFHGRPPSLGAILKRDDQYQCSLWREGDLTAIFEAPAQLSMAERLLLFSVVLGQRPSRAVEIGSFRGGSAQIIVQAMDLNGFGELVMIDPSPDLLMQPIEHRARLVVGTSPGAFADIPGSFDFAFIDATHSRECVRADLKIVEERLTPGGIVLLHDVLHPDVRLGVADAVMEGAWVDCGLLSSNASFDSEACPWAGLGMMRKGSVRPSTPASEMA